MRVLKWAISGTAGISVDGGELMYFHFLIEDQSSAILIKLLMEKLTSNNPDLAYQCTAFKGLGGFTKKNTVKETRTGKLLNDLATYLRGFNKSLKDFPSAIIIVLDNDKNNPEEFREELESVAQTNGIIVDHVFCIAVEEMEAWLLGDRAALMAAYPSAKAQVLNSYRQDSICGTWELLADAVYPGGLIKLRRNCPTYKEIGSCKCEWAQKIGTYMDPENNQSPSFQYFLSELKKRMTVA